MKTIQKPVTPQTHTLRPKLHLSGLALVAALTLAATGCANVPLKSDKLLLAREAVVHATNMGANVYAPVEMLAARERLDYAQTALNAGDLKRAARRRCLAFEIFAVHLIHTREIIQVLEKNRRLDHTIQR